MSAPGEGGEAPRTSAPGEAGEAPRTSAPGEAGEMPHTGAPTGADDEVRSPCISVCAIIPGTALCAGCLRTLDEIAVWSVLDAADKRAVLAALPARRTAHGAAAARLCRDIHAKR